MVWEGDIPVVFEPKLMLFLGVLGDSSVSSVSFFSVVSHICVSSHVYFLFVERKPCGSPRENPCPLTSTAASLFGCPLTDVTDRDWPSVTTFPFLGVCWLTVTVSHHSRNPTTSFTPCTSLLYLQVNKIYSSEVWKWSLKPCCTLLAQFLVHFCYTLVAFLLLILATLWYTSEHSHASKLGFQQISQAVLDLEALLGTTL